MWNRQGRPFNFTKPVLGKITKTGGSLLSRRGDLVLVTSDPGPVKNWRYAAVLTDQQDVVGLDQPVPCISCLSRDDLEHMQDGDIVLLEPDGKVNLLYDIDATDNALLATERCNCRCVMCPQPPKQDRQGLQDLNLALIRLMDPKRTKTMCITGGEPTLLGDGFIQLVEECKKYLPRVPLAVLTNGKTFSEFKFTRKLVDVGHPDLTLCIALYADQDTLHDEIVGVPGSFYDTVKGITNLALFNHKIEIRTVISAKNYRRLPQFSDFVYRNFPFVVHTAFMGMEMTGLAKKNYDHIWVDPLDYMPQLENAVKRLARGNMNISVYNQQLCVLPKALWRYSRKSISTWKNEYLTSCSVCKERQNCGGFFRTSGGISSRGINPIA